MADRDLVRGETNHRDLTLGPKPSAPLRKRSSEDELAHVRAQWQHYQASAERERSQMQEELAKVRTQWGQLQQRLDQERRARRLEAARSSALIARLQRELEQFASRHANPDGRQSGFDAVIAVLVAVVVALAIWIAVPVRGRDSPPPRPAALAGPAPDPDRAARQSIQQSMRRLNDALSSIPDRSPEEVFRAIRERFGRDDPYICAFEWKNGQPALIYGGAATKTTIAATLTRCAEAVEKYK